MGNREKTDGFEDLDVWQHAIEIAAAIYKITDKFPPNEQYGLTSQLRRSSSSISANIAEGYGRRNKVEKSQFYKIAYGSLLEVKSFVLLAKRLGFAKPSELGDLMELIVVVQKELNALIGSMQKK